MRERERVYSLFLGTRPLWTDGGYAPLDLDVYLEAAKTSNIVIFSVIKKLAGSSCESLFPISIITWRCATTYSELT